MACSYPSNSINNKNGVSLRTSEIPTKLALTKKNPSKWLFFKDFTSIRLKGTVIKI